MSGLASSRRGSESRCLVIARPGVTARLGAPVRTLCIALVSGVGLDEDAPVVRPSWWDALFRAWPECASPPRVESATHASILDGSEDLGVRPHWDAVVLESGPREDEASLCRVLDVLQQAGVPALLLTNEKPERLSELHPGAVLVHGLDNADWASLAAMLYALATRQTAVRAMEQSLELAQSFQGETAAEIDRLHQELLLAARVQRDCMPKRMPEHAGLDAAVLFRPVGFVSGDIYDVFRLDEHHVGVFLADAMGHGVPAALLTLYLTGSLPRKELTASGYRIIPPGEAMGRLNNGLHECMAGPARFATAVYAIIDTRTGLTTVACAGHPAPLRISPGPHGATVRPIDCSGMLLGVVADYVYEPAVIRLDPSELLVFHSDGIDNAFSTKREGERTPRQAPPFFPFLSQMRAGESLRDLNTAMIRLSQDIDRQSGSLHQDDDLTVIAVQAVGATTAPVHAPGLTSARPHSDQAPDLSTPTPTNYTA